ncbi:unnamed protein product [Discosporangium mesarthrocarpum]
MTEAIPHVQEERKMPEELVTSQPGISGHGAELVWVPEKFHVEKPETYAQSCGCASDWRSVGFGVAAIDWLKGNRQEVLAGLTVALTIVPTAVAFSFLAGVSPQVGLTGSWIIALILAIFGGRSGMIYCNAGAIAVVVAPLVENEGVEYMFYAFMLSGIITTILGFLKVAKLLRLLPASAMIGFVNGLAIVIFLAQLKNFQIEDETHDGDHGRRLSTGGGLGSFDVLTNGATWVQGEELAYMLINVAITMAVMGVMPKFTSVPSALGGIVVSTIFEWAIVRAAIGSETNTLQDVAEISGGVPVPVWNDPAYDLPPLDGNTLGTIIGPAITISAVGLIESLMTVRLVDETLQSKGNPHTESVWLGVGNLVAGAFGQGGCSEIGLTMINLKSGGRTRVAGVISALLVLFFILVASPVINLIPVAGLVGVMFVVVIHTFEWSSLRMLGTTALPGRWRSFLKGEKALQKIKRADALVVLVVTVVTPFTDLAIAVAAGCAVALLNFAWDSSNNISAITQFRRGTKPSDPPVTKIYELMGPLFYGSVDRFLDLFDHHNDPPVVEIHCHQADIFDYSALQAINTLGERYKTVGKRLLMRRIKNESLKVITKANNLMNEEVVVSLEPESFEPPTPVHLGVEEYTEQTKAKAEAAQLFRHRSIAGVTKNGPEVTNGMNGV